MIIYAGMYLFYRNFTEFHLAQIKTIVPDFYKFSLVKLSNDGSVYDLVITSVYGKYR